MRLLWLVVMLYGVAWGQDGRVVFEPRVPPVCKVLMAELTPENGGLPESVERHYRDTDRIEKAMRHCGAGQAVALRLGAGRKNVFLVGPVRLSAGVTLLVEAGVGVWGSRDPRNYDVAAGSCGMAGAKGPGCKALFTADGQAHSGIMGDGVIDGRGGARLLLADGKEGETWWELGRRARMEDKDAAVARLVLVRRSDDFVLYRVTLRNSPGVHVSGEETNGLTVWGVKMETPRTARGTEGFDLGNGTQNVTIADTFVRAGEDAPARTAHVTLRNDHFFYGHGAGGVEFPVTYGPVSAESVPGPDATFYVAADGSGDYTSVAAALKKVPATGGLVLVAPGVYRERVFVRQNHVTLKSANADAAKTVIVFDLSKGTQGQAEGFATVRVTGDDFLAENLTFENDFNRTHKQENQGSQARALALVGDRNVLRNVRILGNQDTFYLGAKGCGEATGSSCEAGRTYVSRSLIAGNVDFIYGDGLAYFEDCEIRSTEHAAGGFITAQGKHYAGQESGFIFKGARLTAEAGVSGVYLGRPWRDLANVVFVDSAIGSHVAAAGWREWHPGETHRLDTAYYRTWNTAGIAGKQLAPGEVGRYSVRGVLGGKDGWDPAQVR